MPQSPTFIGSRPPSDSARRLDTAPLACGIEAERPTRSDLAPRAYAGLGHDAKQSLQLALTRRSLRSLREPSRHQLPSSRDEDQSGPGCALSDHALTEFRRTDGALGCRHDPFGQCSDIAGGPIDQLIELV